MYIGWTAAAAQTNGVLFIYTEQYRAFPLIVADPFKLVVLLPILFFSLFQQPSHILLQQHSLSCVCIQRQRCLNLFSLYLENKSAFHFVPWLFVTYTMTMKRSLAG